MWVTLLTVLVVISAALTISAEYHGPRRVVYIFKPLTLLFIIALALLPKYPVEPFYRYMILAGLACSLAGDVFLMLPSDRFMQGLLCFLVAHLCYIAAFVFAGGRAVSAWVGAALVIYGGLMLGLLWRRLGKLKAPVIVYMIMILLMGVTALSWYLKTRQGGSFLAALGAVLFIASDSLLAVNRFRGGFRSAQFLILSTYFAAQWLIALST